MRNHSPILNRLPVFAQSSTETKTSTDILLLKLAAVEASVGDLTMGGIDSSNYSIIEVNCKNAPGVLYMITVSMADLGIQIKTASISTYGNRVVDIFYIKNAFGSKVDDTITIDKIKKSILKILEEINFT